MYRLSGVDRLRVVAALVEGNSIRSTVRTTRVAKNTIVKLLVELGTACAAYHDKNVQNLRVRRLRCDERWSFVYAKKKNAALEQKENGWGDVWTWTAIDTDTKLCVNYAVGGLDASWAWEFIQSCSERIKGRVQVTIDEHKAYLNVVEGRFGIDCDHALLRKTYGAPTDVDISPYFPVKHISRDDENIVIGNSDRKHGSTSLVERQNATKPICMRRFTSLANGFSKKLENHVAAVALYFSYYNYCRVHQTLRVTPAMESGISDHVWSLGELVALIEKPS